MKTAAFLIPVASAIAALVPGAAAAVAPASAPQLTTEAVKDPGFAIRGSDTGVLEYLRGDERHLMLMQRDGSGVVMAMHQSHSSHSSHSSHASHRSSAY